MGEAKWRSPVGAKQGELGDKDQLTLRREFCQKYGRILTGCRHFLVLGVSLDGAMLPHGDTTAEGVTIHARDVTWESLARLDSHPLAQEFRDYLCWKRKACSCAVCSPEKASAGAGH